MKWLVRVFNLAACTILGVHSTVGEWVGRLDECDSKCCWPFCNVGENDKLGYSHVGIPYQSCVINVKS